MVSPKSQAAASYVARAGLAVAQCAPRSHTRRRPAGVTVALSRFEQPGGHPMIWDLQITERDGVRVHRSRLEPGESSPWNVDSFHRVSVVLQGEQLRIEYQHGGEPELVPVAVGQVEWDEPSSATTRWSAPSNRIRSPGRNTPAGARVPGLPWLHPHKPLPHPDETTNSQRQHVSTAS
jgi:hypothetical protein